MNVNGAGALATTINYLTRHCFWPIILVCGAAAAQDVRRIPDAPIVATQITQAAGHVWLATPQGAYRIDGDLATRFPDTPTNVTAVSEIDGKVWLATTDGAYRVDGDHAVRVPSDRMVVSSVVKAGGAIWFATPKGAFRMSGDPLGDPSNVQLKRVPDQDLDVMEVVPVGSEVWLGMFGGAYHVAGDTAQRLPALKYALNQIMDVGGAAWLATDEGPYVYNGRTADHLKGIATESFHLHNVGGHVWIVAADGAYRVDGDTARRIPDIKLSVSDIGFAGGHVWVSSRTGAYRIDGDAARRIPDRDMFVSQVSDVAAGGRHEAWIASKAGAFEVAGDTARRVPNLNAPVRQIADLDGNAWLATDAGAFVVRSGLAVRTPDSDADVLSMHSMGDELWIGTTNGVFRVRGSGQPGLALVLDEQGWRQRLQGLLPGGLRLAGQYRVETDSVDPGLQAVAGVDRGDYGRSVSAGGYTALHAVRLTMPAGKHTAFVAVRGRWSGSEYALRGTFVPPALILLVITLIAWLGIHALVFALTPYSGLCRLLTMSRGWRDYASFGLIPLVLTVSPAARRRLCRRYLDAVRADPAYATAGVDGVGAADLVPDDIQNGLAAGRIVALNAAGDIDLPSYLRYLAGCYASRRRRGLLPARAMPLLLDPEDVDRSPGRQALDRLREMGDVSDENLAAWLLSRQPLLLLLPAGASGDWLSDLGLYRQRGTARYLCAEWDTPLESLFGLQLDRIDLGIPEAAEADTE